MQNHPPPPPVGEVEEDMREAQDPPPHPLANGQDWPRGQGQRDIRNWRQNRNWSQPRRGLPLALPRQRETRRREIDSHRSRLAAVALGGAAAIFYDCRADAQCH